MTGDEPDFLTEEERRRLSGFRFEKRRKEWLFGRWAAKSLLVRSGQSWTNGRMDCFQISNEESGAPYVADLSGSRLPGCLSISHRAGGAFCVYNPDSGTEIGADLEFIEPKNAVFFDDYFTPAEQALVRSSPNAKSWLAIAIIWSAKEAVFKAMRTGLRLDTRSVEIGIANGSLSNPLIMNWHPFSVNGDVLPDKMTGKWQVWNEFVLTFAIIGQADVNLIQVNK